MNMLYVLIPLALVLLAAAVWALVWAIQSGQFDDLESQGWSVVLDEDKEASQPNKQAESHDRNKGSEQAEDPGEAQ